MRLLRAILLFLPLFVASQPVAAAVTLQDDNAIADVLVAVQDAVSAGDVDAVVAHIAPQKQELVEAVRAALIGSSISYTLDCSPWSSRRVAAADGTVTVSCTSAVEGVNWNMSGLSASFTLAKNAQGQWMITDTDFHTKLSPGAAFSLIGKIIVPLLLIGLLFGIFWLWMFVDCLRRTFDAKGLWIILLLLLGPIGAVLYFFAVKRAQARA